MTDTTQAANANRKSTRHFIDVNGNEVDKIEMATGARYVIPANGRSFDMQCGEAGKPETMMAIFGAHTKWGNVANTVRNDKNDPGSPDDEADAIADFMENLAAGQWREPSEGGRGPKYDDAILADVLAAIAVKAGLPTDGRTAADYAVKLGDKKYRAQMLAATIACGAAGEINVKTAYAEEALKRGVSKPANAKAASDLL